ncbi:MAG: hypothetical protein RL757_714 [Bacteroidota bacterium]|jgi:hypothetical protein
MKKSIALILSCLFWANLYGQNVRAQIVTTDIDNFWLAYDQIISTTDTVEQYKYLNQLYLNKGSEGLDNIMRVRNYTPQQYLAAIRDYPKFWASIRANTLKTKEKVAGIENDLAQLQKMYPALKPSPIYFTIGVFRTPGTAYKNTVLMGSELSMGDNGVDVSELPQAFAHLKGYFQGNPIESVPLLVAHEFIHTQQHRFVDNLLSYCLYEGIAEFVSCKATGKASTTPAINFGKANEKQVKAKFEADIFRMGDINDWLWGENSNELKIRDLGYYIGYEICERHYNQSKDKNKAIKEMIELDFENEKQVERFVDNTHFFSSPLKKMYKKYDKSRPIVTHIKEFKNGSKQVNPNLTQITLYFSKPMRKNTRGFDFGPLGENNVLRVQKVIGFSEDGTSFTFEVALKPNQRYQSLVTNRFLSVEGVRLKSFLIDITTAKE